MPSALPIDDVRAAKEHCQSDLNSVAAYNHCVEALPFYSGAQAALLQDIMNDLSDYNNNPPVIAILSTESGEPLLTETSEGLTEEDPALAAIIIKLLTFPGI